MLKNNSPRCASPPQYEKSTVAEKRQDEKSTVAEKRQDEKSTVDEKRRARRRAKRQLLNKVAMEWQAVAEKKLREEQLGIKEEPNPKNNIAGLKDFPFNFGIDGIWLGVEWDDPDRGKHDGSKDGKRYFNTLNPTAGSFLRPKKVNFGIPCLVAIYSRYGKIEGENAGVKTEELYVRDASKKRIVVEMVGAKSVNDKQSKLDQLLNVGLCGMAVYGLGIDHDLKTFTPNITEMDLSKNVLRSWDAVSIIASQLSRLQSLDVSENKLQLPTNPESLKSSFESLRTLFINRMGYTWTEVVQISYMFPNLSHLHACYNEISQISNIHQSLPHLELINLECNHISSWSEILHLGCLSKLQTLILNGNSLDSIYFPDVSYSEKTELFPLLKSLSIIRNTIDKMLSINELNKLKCLSELNCRDNPFLSTETEETTRELLIAKIKNLKFLNRSQVMLEARRGAEIDYLKKYGKDWLECGGNRDPLQNNPNKEFMTNHPRYMELVKGYGAPEDSEMKEECKTLKDSLISITISSPMSDKVIQKKLPLTMSVHKLKALIQRLFRANTGDIKLSYISQKMQGPEIEFDNDLRQLSFYSVENEDTIRVVWD